MGESLTGTIERVTYHNPETGYAVLRVEVRGEPELITVVGNLTNVTAGESLEADGRWVINPDYGRQFKAEQLQTTHPATAAGIEKYLASGAIRSIGPKLARQIVKVYKERTFEIIEHHSDLLQSSVRGLGPKRLKRIRESWQEQREVRRIMLFLQEFGIGSARAVKIYRAYGSQAVELIKNNPYRLADDIRGIGFRTADAIAAKLGIDPNSPERARAAVRYTLQQLTTQGHCAYPQVDLVAETQRTVNENNPLPPLEEAPLEDAIEHDIQKQLLVQETVEGDHWVFLAALHRSEEGLCQSVQRLMTAEGHLLSAVQADKQLAATEERLGITLAEQQRDAVREACRQKLLIVTGGPGTGKTTLVRSILEIFQSTGRRTVLCAPTGRATKRLAETTGQEAKTIHRLLEFDPAAGEFSRNRHRPLSGDLFVLDEASMVDVVLGHQFLRAVPTGATVVLVGDVHQLPSVGPGTVLADLIASEMVPVVRLTQIFRQAGQSRIVAAAHAINSGEMPKAPPKSEELSDYYFIEAVEPEDVQNILVRLLRERIPQRFGLDPLSDVQVLTPMNRSSLGARHLNQILQEALNPAGGAAGREKPSVERFGWTFRVGDRVIQTENNYQREVYNGDLGIISKIDTTEQEVTVDLEGRAVVYDFGDLDELSLAYVLSIHKSQGSEYPCVVIPVHRQHFAMLKRNLIYTGVTRGKRLVVLLGQSSALWRAVTQPDTDTRFTALRLRLQKALQEPA